MAEGDLTREQYNKLIDEWQERDKQFVGKPTAVTPRPIQRLVTEANIYKHAWGEMGDPDPLYTDPEYGKNTRWGGMIAPPTFAHNLGIVAAKVNLPNFPGAVVYHGDTTIDYSTNIPIRPGDEIHITHTYLGYTEKSDPSMPFRRFFLLGDSTGYNQREEVVLTAEMNAKIDVTYPDDLPKMTEILFGDRGKQKPKYTEEQLAEVHEYYEDELAGKHRRGDDILYWEDVQVGDEIPTQITGPYTLIDACSVFGGYWGSFATSWPMARDTAGRGFKDESGEWLGDVCWHFLDDASQMIGIPLAHGFAAQNEANICHGVCNWKGDDAWIKRWYIEQVSPRLYGDMGYVKGKVTKKYIEDGEHVVDLDIWLEEQNGHVCASGNTTVRLVSKEH